MTRGLALALLLAGAAGPARTIASAQAAPAIAVLPFDDDGSYGRDRDEYAALRVGIPAALAGELARTSGGRVVDRTATLAALATLNPGRGRVDAASAARLGEQLKARYIVLGSFKDFYGRVRLNARIVDAQSGEIIAIATNDDPKLQDRSALYRIIQSVATKIAAQLKLDGAATAPGPDVSTEALTLYSRGILALDQGKRAEAARLIREAIAAAPDYDAARDALRRAGG
jgi:TolB-like protein